MGGFKKIDNAKLNEWYVIVKRKLYDIINYGPIAKIIAFIIIWTIALIPAYIYLFFRWVFEPVTFWENLALLVAWILFLGVIQAGALFFAVMLTIFLITESW